MQLERIGTVVRPRNAWESIDLGFSLVQVWWRPLYKIWFAFTLPLLGLVYGIIYWNELGFFTGILTIWWLKPLWDRLILHFLSHILFGECLGVYATFKALPQLLFKTRLFYALTFGRFILPRSFLLPIWQLEGSKGRIRRQREKLLQKHTRNTAVWLTLVCLHFELIIYLSLFGISYLLTPPVYQLDFHGFIFAEPGWMDSMKIIFSGVALSIVEPLYVAGGFVLYLNRRIHLEGWDIELTFRQLASRLST